MAFRFWRRVRIAPGVTLNLSKSGVSVSLGPRGAKLTFGPRGTRVTAGIPGTGFFVTERLSGSKRRRRGAAVSRARRGARREEAAAALGRARAEQRMTLGFLKRLVTPADEEAFARGCLAYLHGREEEALETLSKAAHLVDAAFLAGFLALGLGRLGEAEACLRRVLDRAAELGRLFGKYGLTVHIRMSVSDEVTAEVAPDVPGVLLGLVEVYQQQERWDAALDGIERLMKLAPEEPVVRASAAELLLDSRGEDPAALLRVVELAADAEPASPVGAALQLYKARALRRLGLLEAARDTLTALLRRRRSLPEELVKACRYERALVYEALGQPRRARKDLETLFAEDPGYEDVAARLGVGERGLRPKGS